MGERRFCPVREEWQLGTLRVIRMLVVMDRGHRRNGRRAAIALLRGIAQAFCDQPPVDLGRGMLDVEFDACGAPTTSPGVCSHFEVSLQFVNDGSDVVDSSVFMVSVARQAEHCPGCTPLCRRATLAWVHHIEQRFPESSCHSNPLNTSLHIEGRSWKKRRYGEDYKHAVARDVLGKKRAVSVTAYVAGSGKMANKTAASWGNNSLCSYQTTAWNTMGNLTDFSITMDASRLGQLALDCMMYAMAQGAHVGCLRRHAVRGRVAPLPVSFPFLPPGPGSAGVYEEPRHAQQAHASPRKITDGRSESLACPP